MGTVPIISAFENDVAFRGRSREGLTLGSLRARVKLLAHTAPSDNGHFPEL